MKYKAIVRDFFDDQVYLDLLISEPPLDIETRSLPLVFFASKDIDLGLDTQLLIDLTTMDDFLVPAEDILGVETVEEPFNIPGFDSITGMLPDFPEHSFEELSKSAIFRKKSPD